MKSGKSVEMSSGMEKKERKPSAEANRGSPNMPEHKTPISSFLQNPFLGASSAPHGPNLCPFDPPRRQHSAEALSSQCWPGSPDGQQAAARGKGGRVVQSCGQKPENGELHGVENPQMKQLILAPWNTNSRCSRDS